MQSPDPVSRLRTCGAAASSDDELLAVVVSAGGAGADAAASLLSRFGALDRIFSAGTAELASVGSVDAAGVVRIKAVAEIARRISSRTLSRGENISSSALVHAHFAPLLAGEKRESFHVLMLDSKNRMLAKRRVSEGSLGASLVHPREAFRPAIREAAAAVIFVHNHPSGDPSPSGEDRDVTARLRDAGALLGIPVLDHVIVAGGGYYSFADRGWPGCAGGE